MLELYQFEGCPYSQKVREKLTELGISYVNHNPRLGKNHDRKVTNQQTFEELTELGGKDEVPYLVDTQRETTLYESDEIVEYLDEHYA